MKFFVFKRFATVKRAAVDQFWLDVICTTCKRRGQLWFFKEFTLADHSCPNCNKRTLQSPDWLNHHKAGFSLFLK